MTSPAPTGSDVAWALLAGLGGMALGGVVVLVPVLFTVGVEYTALGLLAAAVGGAGGLWVGLVRRRGWGRRELGFVRSSRSGRHLLWQVPLALVAGLLATVAVGTAVGLAPDEAGDGSQGDFVDTALLTSFPWLVAVGVLCVVLLLPAVEEVVFRRVLLGWLLTRLPVSAAVVVASLVFAAVHVAPVAILYLFFLAVAANLLYLWHRSLWAPLALHAANNALVSLVALAALGA